MYLYNDLILSSISTSLVSQTYSLMRITHCMMTFFQVLFVIIIANRAHQGLTLMYIDKLCIVILNRLYTDL